MQYNPINKKLLKSRLLVSRLENFDEHSQTNQTISSEFKPSRMRCKSNKDCVLFRKNKKQVINNLFPNKNKQNNKVMNSIQLKEQLYMKNKKLQQWIQKIVQEEKKHQRKLTEIENQDQQQIAKLHQILENIIRENKALQQKISLIQALNTSSDRQKQQSMLLLPDSFMDKI